MKILLRIKHFYSYIIFYFILSALALFSVMSYNSEYKHNQDKISNLIGETDFLCKVSGYPQTTEGKIKFEAEIIKSTPDYLNGIKIYITANAPTKNLKLRYGDTLSIKAPITLPTTAGIEGGFDYRNYLKSIDIEAVCRVEAKDISRVSSGKGTIKYISDIRDSFMSSTSKYMSPKHAGLVKAITTGDRAGISDSDADSFKKCGIYHIVAISGLHLNIFICCISYLISRLRVKKLRKAFASGLICMLAAVFILIFTGFGVSVKRALIMLIVCSLASFSTRDYNVKNSLLISGFVIVIFTPYSLYSTAFWLSFLSTFAVLVSADISEYLYNFTSFKSANKYLFVTSLISVTSAIFTLPVTASGFGYIPLYSIVANAVILPFMPYLLVSSVVFAFSTFIFPSLISKMLAAVCEALSGYVLSVARIIADFPSSAITVYPIRAVLILATIAGAAITIYIIHKRRFKTAMVIMSVFCVAIIGVLMYNINDDTVRVTFVDVGQGDCTIIELPGGGCAIIDCGSDYESEYNYTAIKNYMRTNNIKKADVAFVSHYHSDHASSMVKLVEDGYVSKLMMPRHYDDTEDEAANLHNLLIAACLKSRTDISYIQENDKVSFDCGAVFEVLSPSETLFADNNNMSAVISLTYGKSSLLFCGDAEEKTIGKLLDKPGTYDIIKWPHHGSKNSAASDFVKHTKPGYAVISCGANNIYGQPDQSIINLLKEEKVQYYRTDRNGSVTFEVTEDKIKKVSTMR